MLKKVFIILSIFAVVGLMGMVESNYTREVTVISVDCAEATVTDTQGNQWTVKDNNYKEGDTLTVVMNDRHTSTVTDDTIVRVK